MSFWESKKVLVTGGAGFIGSHAVEMLLQRGAAVTVADNFSNGSMDNLRDVEGNVRVVDVDLMDLAAAKQACQGQEIVMNLAAKVGGIGYNATHSGTMFRDNIIVETNTLEAARDAGVERFLVVSSACVYPPDCTIPTPETEGFRADPEPTNYGYGWAKRMNEVLARAYQKEFGMRIAIARPYNAYGPRDHFNPDVSHVIAAIIKRIFDQENPLTVWGSGEQTRAFLYVEDFARGLIEVAERYPECDPINIGTNEEIKIKDLAALIIEISGRPAEVRFDTTKSAGQPRRNCDCSKARGKVDFSARIALKEGLAETIDWYRRCNF